MIDFQYFSVWNQAFKLSSTIAPFSVVRPGQLLLFGGAFVLQFFLFGNVRSSRNRAKWQRYFDFQVTSKWLWWFEWLQNFSSSQSRAEVLWPWRKTRKGKAGIAWKAFLAFLTFHPLICFPFVQASKNKLQDLSTPSKQEVESILEASDCPEWSE